MRLVRCPSCGAHYVANHGTRVSCDECNRPDPKYDEFDARGRLIRQRNRRGQLLYLAASAASLELWGDNPGPRTALPGAALSALNFNYQAPSPFGARP